MCHIGCANFKSIILYNNPMATGQHIPIHKHAAWPATLATNACTTFQTNSSVLIYCARLPLNPREPPSPPQRPRDTDKQEYQQWCDLLRPSPVEPGAPASPPPQACRQARISAMFSSHIQHLQKSPAQLADWHVLKLNGVPCSI